MNTQGLDTITRVNLRTGGLAIGAWVLGLVTMMAVTTTSLVALYDTPEALRTYSESLGSSMRMMNGKVAGMTTLGGVIANEFAIILAFGIPLMAIALTSRVRKDEELGRLELLLASRIGRDAPLTSTVLLAGGAVVLTAAGCWLAMIAVDADVAGALRYAAVVAAVGWVFIGVTAALAQVFEHSRTVWGVSLAVLLGLYLVRGVGASSDNALVWLSPFGWADEVRSFGTDARWWPLALHMLAGASLLAVAYAGSRRRDVGGALLQARPGVDRASSSLRSPWGLAWYEHRNATLGWVVAAAVLMGTYGSLTQEVIDAVESNPALGDVLGTDVDAAAEMFLPSILSAFLLMLALLVAAYVVMSVGVLRASEESGRLEVLLTAPRARLAWLLTHVTVIVLGAVVVGAAGAAAMAFSVAAAMSDSAWVGDVLRGAIPYAVPVAAFLALALAVFGTRPSRHTLAWAFFAVAGVIAYLGPGFDLPGWLLDASLFAALGTNVVGEGAETAPMIAVGALAVVLAAVGVMGFARRDVPRL